MTEPWEDPEDLDDALLPSNDELTDLVDDFGWTPETEPPIDEDD